MVDPPNDDEISMATLQELGERPSPAIPATARTISRRWVFGLCVLIAVTPFLPEVARVTLGSNFHVVVEKRLYRAAQPSGSAVDAYIRDYGIRTVINLRGLNPDEPWFNEEARAADAATLAFSPSTCPPAINRKRPN